MYGNIYKTQMVRRVYSINLFCFCDMTFLFSQEYGKFISNIL